MKKIPRKQLVVQKIARMSAPLLLAKRGNKNESESENGSENESENENES